MKKKENNKTHSLKKKKNTAADAELLIRARIRPHGLLQSAAQLERKQQWRHLSTLSMTEERKQKHYPYLKENKKTGEAVLKLHPLPPPKTKHCVSCREQQVRRPVLKKPRLFNTCSRCNNQVGRGEKKKALVGSFHDACLCVASSSTLLFFFFFSNLP